MLKKSEELVLKVISDNAYKGESCLMSLSSVVEFIGNQKLVNEKNVFSIINDLYESEYIDLITTIKNDEKLYLFTLLKKGKNYKQEKVKEIRSVKNRIVLSIICACISFIVGRILIVIFK
ncbi:MAG: hypothetical protein J6Q38_00970 [Clostridia bacterium]|nr:hypothetical protein [Clostridia bacterium]